MKAYWKDDKPIG